jgi:hypothetical protein
MCPPLSPKKKNDLLKNAFLKSEKSEIRGKK